MRGKGSGRVAAQRNGARREWNGAWKVLLKRGIGQLWHFFTSVRLAVVLILVHANLSLIGTLLIQVPPETAANPSEYAWWLENVVRPRIGFWTSPLAFLGLFDVFHSPWFLGAGALLVINIVVCSLNRWKQISGAIVGTSVKLSEGFYERGSNRAQFIQEALSSQGALAAVTNLLRRRGFRVRTENTSDNMYIAADKNRYFRLGTYLVHISIILIILGYTTTNLKAEE